MYIYPHAISLLFSFSFDDRFRQGGNSIFKLSRVSMFVV
jgi:hypothetical protein